MKPNFKTIDKDYLDSKEMGISKLAYICEEVFNITTYDDDIAEYFALKMIEVIQSIIDKKTFEYHGESKENYINYISMVNMPFLVDKLEWGTSIRGAWIEHGLKDIKIGVSEQIEIKRGEFEKFLRDLIDWSKT